MASASTLRRTRRGFLVVAILAFLVAGGLFLFATRPGHPPGRLEVKPPPRVAVQHPGHGDTNATPPGTTIEPVPPATAAAPAPAPLSSLGAFASLSTALIALLGFVVTSVLTVRRERRDSALFAIDLEMKRAQLAEMQSRAAQAGKVAAG
jgi:hypothetical protein